MSATRLKLAIFGFGVVCGVLLYGLYGALESAVANEYLCLDGNDLVMTVRRVARGEQCPASVVIFDGKSHSLAVTRSAFSGNWHAGILWAKDGGDTWTRLVVHRLRAGDGLLDRVCGIDAITSASVSSDEVQSLGQAIGR
jgi:hypothetical protein